MTPEREGACQLPTASPVPDLGPLHDHSLYACPRWLHVLAQGGRLPDAYLTQGRDGRAVGLLPLHMSRPTDNRRYLPGHLARGLAPQTGDNWAFAGAVSAYHTEVPAVTGSDPCQSVPELLEVAAQTCESRHRDLVVPYLTADAACYLPVAVAERLVLEDFDCWLTSTAEDLAAYRDGLRNKRAADIGRDLRRFASAGLHAEVGPLGECLTGFAWLVAHSADKHGQQADQAEVDRLVVHLTTISEVFGGDAVVFAARTERGDLVGGALGIMHAGVLYMRMTGFDEAATSRTSAYFRLMFSAPLDFRRRRPHRSVHYGTGSLVTKALHGAVLRPLWTLLPPRVLDRPDAARVSGERLAVLTEGLPAALAGELHDGVARHYREQR